MTKQDLENWLIGKGYKKDKFGHYQKEINGETYRFKLSSISARYERKAKIVDHNEWLRIASGYFKDLNVMSAGKLKGIK
jgi:hypothetical protein